MNKNKITKDIIFEPRNNYSHIADSKKTYDCIVIGTGPAGYSSAMYASRLGLKVLIIGEIPGGTLAFAGKVENYPGFVSIDGQKLMELLENHAMDYDVDIETDIVTNIEKEKKIFKVIASEKIFFSKSIIYTAGSEVKKLNILGEKEFSQKGVSYCALCEAAFVKNKTVAVVGGGDSAVKEAILLCEYAKKVIIINNEKDIHPEISNKKILDSLLSEGKVKIINNNEIIEIIGKDKVEKVMLKQCFQEKKEIEVEGVFIYIGQSPKSLLAKNIGVKLNKKKEVIVDSHCETNIKGFFAAGDVTNTEWKQAIIGVSQGVTSAYYAYQFVKKNK
jgi:thioredoxin-disulfide reductase